MTCNTIYRISKYDPAFRINGVYTRDEWTDYGCIGKIFLGKRFTRREYVAAECCYLNTLRDVLEHLSITQMTKGEMEWNHNTFYRIVKSAPSTAHMDGILKFSKGCLRNKYWAKLLHPDLSIHFSLDYYMELCCDMSKLSKEEIYRIVRKNHLHCQMFVYNAAEDMYHETASI